MRTQQLGTKKFWKSLNTLSEKENQVLKNSGYITVHLVSVSYMSEGSFFQNIFGGKDKIALSTNISYGNGQEAISATAVQDVTEVKSNKNYLLGLSRIIAEKVPANTNSLSVSVRMTAVKNDQLQSKFDMLNKPEYQGALKLAPAAIGQVLTITSLVKGLFTDSSEQPQLEASFAGIISQDADDHPINSGSLTQGLLFMIAANETNAFDNADSGFFTLDNYTLKYKNKAVQNTYIVLRVTFEKNKGEDQKANWAMKYRSAVSNLDKLMLALDDVEKEKIKKDSITMWIEGNVLLDEDQTYIAAEKMKIKAAYLAEINKLLNPPTIRESSKNILVTELLRNMFDENTDMGIFGDALPETAAFFRDHIGTDTQNYPLSEIMAMKVTAAPFYSSLSRDADNYKAEIIQGSELS